MVVSRRSVLRYGALVAGSASAGCQQSSQEKVARFSFDFQGYDDSPDVLRITHTDGNDLPANEVYITNVAIDYREEVTGTVAWHELDEDVGPTDGIADQTAVVELLFPDVVQILWRHDGEEQVIGETRSFR